MVVEEEKLGPGQLDGFGVPSSGLRYPGEPVAGRIQCLTTLKLLFLVTLDGVGTNGRRFQPVDATPETIEACPASEPIRGFGSTDRVMSSVDRFIGQGQAMNSLPVRPRVLGSVSGLVGRTQRWGARLLFVLLSASIVVVSSEKFYWYPQGFSALVFAELAAFYALPVAGTLWVVERFKVVGVWRLVLASGLFALGVEGIITPVLYEDGPLPLLALYFFAWHGILSLVFCRYLARKWALAGRRANLAAGSALYGAVWGLWSVTYWRTESIEELEAENAAGEANWDPGQWSVPKFALYAATFTIVLIVAHWLLGFVWPKSWQTTRRWNLATGLLLAAGLAIMTVAIPWAPLKLGFLGWLILRRLRKSNTMPDDATLFDELQGRATPSQLAPLALLAPTAVAAYGSIAALDPSSAVLDGIYGGTVTVQIIAGLIIVVIAFRRTKPAPHDDPALPVECGSPAPPDLGTI